jgi:uncharacterized membrane protein
MRAIQFFIVSALLCALCVAGHAQDEDKYTCDQFQFFGPTDSQGNTIPLAHSLNDSDLVVGELEDQSEYGFYSRAGISFNTFVVPGSSSTIASGVNNAGKIVGSYFTVSSNVWHGFENAAGRPITIDYPGAQQTFPTGINNQDQIVGSYVPQSEPVTGFVLSKGHFATLSVEGASETLPAAINDSSAVVGWWDTAVYAYPFIYIDGNYTLPTTPPTAQLTLFTGINNQGEIAGYYLETDSAVFKSFIFVNGIYNIVAIPNARWVRLGGINDHGDITGTIMTSAGEQPAFLGTGCRFRD